MRKSKEIKVEAEGRDKGKVFVVTEMPAMQTEKWAARALQGLTASGVDLPDDVGSGGAAALAAYGVRALGRIEFATLETLLAEMMTCIAIREPALVRALTPDDVEEVPTLLLLRREWFGLHFAFFTDVARSLTAGGRTTAPN